MRIWIDTQLVEVVPGDSVIVPVGELDRPPFDATVTRFNDTVVEVISFGWEDDPAVKAEEDPVNE